MVCSVLGTYPVSFNDQYGGGLRKGTSCLSVKNKQQSIFDLKLLVGMPSRTTCGHRKALFSVIAKSIGLQSSTNKSQPPLLLSHRTIVCQDWCLKMSTKRAISESEGKVLLLP